MILDVVVQRRLSFYDHILHVCYSQVTIFAGPDSNIKYTIFISCIPYHAVRSWSVGASSSTNQTWSHPVQNKCARPVVEDFTCPILGRFEEFQLRSLDQFSKYFGPCQFKQCYTFGKIWMLYRKSVREQVNPRPQHSYYLLK